MSCYCDFSISNSGSHKHDKYLIPPSLSLSPLSVCYWQEMEGGTDGNIGKERRRGEGCPGGTHQPGQGGAAGVVCQARGAARTEQVCQQVRRTGRDLVSCLVVSWCVVLMYTRRWVLVKDDTSKHGCHCLVKYCHHCIKLAG